MLLLHCIQLLYLHKPTTFHPTNPTHQLASNPQLSISLLLPTLLLRRHNPKVAICGLLLLTHSGGILARTLLRHLAPASSASLRRTSRTSALGRRRSIDEALVRKTLAADEVLGKVARVDRVAVGVDRFDKDLSLGGEEDELGDELFGYRGC